MIRPFSEFIPLRAVIVTFDLFMEKLGQHVGNLTVCYSVCNCFISLETGKLYTCILETPLGIFKKTNMEKDKAFWVAIHSISLSLIFEEKDTIRL